MPAVSLATSAPFATHRFAAFGSDAEPTRPPAGDRLLAPGACQPCSMALRTASAIALAEAGEFEQVKRRLNEAGRIAGMWHGRPRFGKRAACNGGRRRRRFERSQRSRRQPAATRSLAGRATRPDAWRGSETTPDLAPDADWRDGAEGSRGRRQAGYAWLLENEMVRACLALVALVALVRPTEAGERLAHLLDNSGLTAAYLAESDLVTAYATGMARYRLQLMARSGTANLATPLEPRALRPEFRQRTWRAADGSLLQGFAGKGGFRLTVGNCLARICAASECSEAGWPVYACSDGRKRKMSVQSFATATFDGIPYRRLSAPPEP